MSCKILSWLFPRLEKKSAGKTLPPSTEKLNECYAKIDTSNRWQGDVYRPENFDSAARLPDTVQLWMLLNRTCQLYETGNRGVKLDYLNFAAVTPLHSYVNYEKKIGGKQVPTLRNQARGIIGEEDDAVVFLPQDLEHQVPEHLVVDFNLIYTVRLSHCPAASVKNLQLSSPFAEYVFQRFARFFYTVGYDNDRIRSDAYLREIENYLEAKRPK